MTGIIGSHILKGPDPPRRGSDGPGLANILSHQIKVRAVVRYRAGYPIGKFGTVKQNRGPNVVRCRAFCREKCLRCKPNLDPTRTMALTACACWERSIGWPSASCVFKCCKVTVAPAKPSQRLLERLLGRRTNALTNFFANLGIVLCHLQNGVVFLQREALINNCLRQGIDGLIRNALLVGGGRRGYPLLIILLETGHPLYGGCHRIELLVRNIRRLVGETGRRRLDLSVCCGNGEKPPRQLAGPRR